MTKETKNKKSPPSLTLDVERYNEILEDENIPEAQRRELLETLWSLVCELVWMGWEIHPAQQAEKACGKAVINGADSPLLSPEMLESKAEKLTDNFKQKAELKADSEAEGVPA